MAGSNFQIVGWALTPDVHVAWSMAVYRGTRKNNLEMLHHWPNWTGQKRIEQKWTKEDGQKLVTKGLDFRVGRRGGTTLGLEKKVLCS